VSKRKEHRFPVQLKVELYKKFADSFAAILQMFFALVDEDEIVHISDVSPYMELFFYEMVEIVKNRERDVLADLRAETETYAAVAVNNFVNAFYHLRVIEPLSHSRLCDIVIDAREEMVYITFQRPSVSSVLPVIFPQMMFQPVARELNAFAFLTGTVIVNERARDLLNKAVPAQAVLQLSVFDSRCDDFPLLRLCNVKPLIRADFVCAVEERLPQDVCVAQSVAFIPCDRVFPPYCVAGLLQALVQLLKRYGVTVYSQLSAFRRFDISHIFTSSEVGHKFLAHTADFGDCLLY